MPENQPLSDQEASQLRDLQRRQELAEAQPAAEEFSDFHLKASERHTPGQIDAHPEYNPDHIVGPAPEKKDLPINSLDDLSHSLEHGGQEHISPELRSNLEKALDGKIPVDPAEITNQLEKYIES